MYATNEIASNHFGKGVSFMKIIAVTSDTKRTSALVEKNFDEPHVLDNMDVIEISDAPLSNADEEACKDMKSRTEEVVNTIVDKLEKINEHVAIVIDVTNIAISSYLVLATTVMVNIDPKPELYFLVGSHLVDIIIPLNEDTLISVD